MLGSGRQGFVAQLNAVTDLASNALWNRFLPTTLHVGLNDLGIVLFGELDTDEDTTGDEDKSYKREKYFHTQRVKKLTKEQYSVRNRDRLIRDQTESALN